MASVTPRVNQPCNAFVYWWDGEYEGFCELERGHSGDHFDGASWYDDGMEDRTLAHREDG